MTYYIYQRMKSMWLHMLIIVCGTHVIYQFFEDIGSVAVGGLFVCAFMGIQSNWVQNLPYSRKRILLWSAFESLVAIASAIFFCVFIVFPMKLVQIDTVFNETSGLFVTWGILIFVLFFIRFCFVMKNETKKNYNSVIRKRFVWALAIFGIGVPLLHYFGKQPSLWLLFALIGLIGLPLAAYSMLIPPKDTLRGAIENSIYSLVGLVLLICSYGASEVLFLPPTARTDLTLGLMGDISIPLSRERALELLNSSKIGDSKFALKLEQIYGSEIKFADLKSKSDKCDHRDCISLVTTISRQFNENQRLELFATILKRCSLKVSSQGFVVCSISLTDANIHEWFSLLAESKVIDQWLQSDDVNKRFASIRVLEAPGATTEQLKEIEKIMKEYDDFSSFEAKQLISKHQPRALRDQKKCKIDESDLACERLSRSWISQENKKSTYD